MKFLWDGSPVEFMPGESVLTALLRAGQTPNGGGCLCLGGDCPSCVATVDGVSYVRTCQVRARPGMLVERHPETGCPPLPGDTRLTEHPTTKNLFCDVAAVFFGPDAEGEKAVRAARDAGKDVVVLDSEAGQEVIGVYAGPLILARTDYGVLYLNVREEIIVATGAAEILPVVEGSGLRGLYTARAVEELVEAGLRLGRLVAVGAPPEAVDCTHAEGELLRFEGEEGRVAAVVTLDRNGREVRTPCDSVSLGLGKHPRDQLALMASDLPVKVTVVGGAALTADLPLCPAKGVVCPCEGVSMEDLEFTWESGFQEMELIKRSTLAGTGTCQGMGCLPYLRSFIKKKSGELQPRFTARPVVRQLTMSEIAAGAHHSPELRTALHHEHLRLGAHMERSGPWWRPWNYGDPKKEYWAVREGVSVMDVSTLGKMIVSGPDALKFLEHIYPTQISTIKEGRARYVLLLDERGYVFDDGLVARESDTRFSLTFTSGGSSHSEMWLRDWATSLGFDVRIMNLTYSRGAINVTGPLAHTLLERLGLTEPLKFMNFRDVDVAGTPCRIYRLSFTGEASFELHHSIEFSVGLWRALLAAGHDLGIRPHGLEALTLLRLEKGHIIVNQDTDFDSTPRRLQHTWMVKMEKENFVGRHALSRTDALDQDKLLVGLSMPGDPPFEGATIRVGGEYAGFVTSSGYSHALGQSVMMGHLHFVDGKLPETVTVDGREARRVELPFYDKEGARARA